VAGYDLGRFLSGSLGTVAVVVDATFKLAPRLRYSVTLRVPCENAAAMARACRAVAASQLEPSAVDVRVTEDRGEVVREVFVRFASSPAATEAQAQACQTLVPRAERLEPADEARVWAEQVALPWRGTGAATESGAPAMVRCSWLPSALPAVVERLDECRKVAPIPAFVGRAAVGAGVLRIGGPVSTQNAAVKRLCEGPAAHVVVLSADSVVKAAAEASASPVSSWREVAAIRRSFDPAGIFGAGRGPL
jgi:glycolate oxidase FAD binding subunit